MPQFDIFTYMTLYLCFLLVFVISFFHILFLWCPLFLYISVMQKKYSTFISQINKGFIWVKASTFKAFFYFTINWLCVLPFILWCPILTYSFQYIFYYNKPFFINGILQRI